MCCFSRPVKVVSSTSIFARRSAPGRQTLAYAMTIEASEPLAMILPLPVAAGTDEQGVRFLDLSGYPALFQDLHDAFPAVLEPSRSASLSAPQSLSRKPLQVHDVGAFEASFVPALADFSRLDHRFRLDPVVWSAIPAYHDHGFAVFQLKGFEASSWLARLLRRAQRKTLHPMAFDFPTRAPEHLFFPTMHIHDGQVRAQASFDHTLFLQSATGRPAGCEPDVAASPSASDLWLAGDEAAKHLSIARSAGVVAEHGRLYKCDLRGSLVNADRWVSLAA